LSKTSIAKEETGKIENATGTEQHQRENDRRYVRSRRMLHDAAISLIEERGIDGFNVSDVTDRADLNRSTFYSHFKDKNDLVHFCEVEFFDELSDIEAEMADVSPEELGMAYIGLKPLQPLVDIFEFLGKHSGLLNALIGPNGDIGFERRMLDTVCNTIVDRVLSPKYKENRTKMVDYYVAYFSHASLGVVRTWIETGMKETPEEMAGVLVHLSFLSPGDPIEVDGDLR
jgi:AcrR family transcriptional regulator